MQGELLKSINLYTIPKAVLVSHVKNSGPSMIISKSPSTGLSILEEYLTAIRNLISSENTIFCRKLLNEYIGTLLLSKNRRNQGKVFD